MGKRPSKRRRATTKASLTGKRMREARLAAGLTLEEAAPLISEALGRKKHYTVTTISNWEIGNKEMFRIEEIDAVAKVYGQARDFFTTEENISLYKREYLPKPAPLSSKKTVPLISFEELGRTGMKKEFLSEEGLREKYHCHFPLAGDGIALPIVDSSNSPLLIESKNVVVVALGIEPNPGDLVLVRHGGKALLRVYKEVDDGITLTPKNPVWKTLKFTTEEWARDVEQIGVAVEYGTQLRAL